MQNSELFYNNIWVPGYEIKGETKQILIAKGPKFKTRGMGKCEEVKSIRRPDFSLRSGWQRDLRSELFSNAVFRLWMLFGGGRHSRNIAVPGTIFSFVR
jgi:hypothetical protein